MKIRTDFVSNSSSTSFVIITKGTFEEGDFLALMGVPADSPLQPLFDALYYDLKGSMIPYREYYDRRKDAHGNWLELLQDDFSDEVVARVTEAEKSGCNVFVGKLDSETDLIQTFFCTDSFEVESEKIYLNALECAW